MYFWKVDKLVDDFKSNKVTQKEEFKYMILFTILFGITSDPYFFIESSYNLYDFLNTILMVLVSAWGVYYCYQINSGGDNKDFIVRVMCIGLPVLIRVIVISLPVFFLLAFLYGFISEALSIEEVDTEDIDTTLFDLAIMQTFLILYYVFLAKKIRQVAFN